MVTTRFPRVRARDVLDAARWGWSATFSTGPGYEPTPIGSQFSIDSVRGYFIDYSAKTEAASAGNFSSLLPAALAQLALGWWERLLAGDAAASASFLRVCERLRETAQELNGECRWPYRVSVAKYHLSPPWYSALAQGQIASALVRAHQATGDDEFERVARGAIRPLVPNEASDLLTRTSSGPILEEAPTTPPSHILNGWISALWGVWDVHVGLGDPSAGSAFDAGIACLRSHLPAYDVGWWTRYSLYPHPVEDLAKPIYHTFHVHQITALDRLTGAEEFAEAGKRWRAYDTRANRARALAHKGVFTAARVMRAARAPSAA
jgi:heparosan-N-sulfate-glucuronate 5-epimerase